jgi:hypothetical protein
MLSRSLTMEIFEGIHAPWWSEKLIQIAKSSFYGKIEKMEKCSLIAGTVVPQVSCTATFYGVPIWEFREISSIKPFTQWKYHLPLILYHDQERLSWRFENWRRKGYTFNRGGFLWSLTSVPTHYGPGHVTKRQCWKYFIISIILSIRGDRCLDRDLNPISIIIILQINPHRVPSLDISRYFWGTLSYLGHELRYGSQNTTNL